MWSQNLSYTFDFRKVGRYGILVLKIELFPRTGKSVENLPKHQSDVRFSTEKSPHDQHLLF